MANVSYYGTGRRKSSVARVYLVPGKGQITINGRSFNDYIPNGATRLDVLQPLELTGTTTSYDVNATVDGRRNHFEKNIRPLMEHLHDEPWRKRVIDVRNWFSYKAEEFYRESGQKHKTYESR